MALSTNDFGKAVVAAGLMPADALKSFWNALPTDARPKNAGAFAKLLIKQGTLNEFQSQELLSGSGTPLVLGDYVLLAKIGAGGMGQVFKAQHRHMKRLVAVKLLPAALTKDEATVKRFQREVEAAAKLSHPNIVHANDASVQRGVWYLVMEYVEGSDLAHVVKARGPLPIKEAVNYITQAARGLAFAHSKGVVHRDIKPANLLLDNEGTVKILDMGLARFDDGAGAIAAAAAEGLTQSGQVMGTVDYMAPEQALDTRHADARADIYSLGCSLYRLLTGENVYQGETAMQKLMAHQTKPIPVISTKRPDIPPTLDAIFQRMVAKTPDERYQTMAEVVADLEACATPTGSTAKLAASQVTSTFVSDSVSARPHATEVEDGMTAALGNQLMRSLPDSREAPREDTFSSSSDDRTQRGRRRQKTAKMGSKGPTWKNPMVLGVAGAAGLLTVLLGIWVIVRDNEGKPVAKVMVPEGGSVQVTPGQSEKNEGDKSTASKTNSINEANENSPFKIDSVNKTPSIPLKPFTQIARLLSPDYVWSEPESLGPTVDAAKSTNSPALSDDQLCLIVGQYEKTLDPKNGLHEFRRKSANDPWDAGVKLTDDNDPNAYPSLSADGLTLVTNIQFGKRTDGGPNRDLAVRTRPRRDAPWGNRSKIASLNTEDSEYRPVISPDGLSLVFSSDRAGGVGGLDLWVSRRADPKAAWQPPVHLGNKINSTKSDEASQILTDGKTILVNRDGDLFLAVADAQGNYDLRPVPLPTTVKITKCWLSPDGATLYFDNYNSGDEEDGTNEVRLIRRVPKAASVTPLAATASVTPQPSVSATPGKITTYNDPAFQQWIKDTQALPAQQQLEAIKKKLQELNPGFDGKVTGADGSGVPKIENNLVTEIAFVTDKVTDISPLRALHGLKNLTCAGTPRAKSGRLADLSPLQGLKLAKLVCDGTKVFDLSPLRSMALTHLSIHHTEVVDLSPLAGMPLTYLNCSGTKVKELTSLKGMPLTYLSLSNSEVSDIEPLTACPKLKSLFLIGVKVALTDFSTLQNALPGCKIEWDKQTDAPGRNRRAAEWILSNTAKGWTLQIVISNNPKNIDDIQ